MPVSFVKSGSKLSNTAKTLFAGLAVGMTFASTAQAQLVDGQVAATYQIDYNGLSMGKLHFNSTVNGRSYKMETVTKLSIPLLGSIFNSLSWRGHTKTTGTISGNQPRPKKYAFTFRSGKKAGQIKMDFSGNRVSRVARIPNKKLSSAHVRVTNAHLKRVMDPMSALMTIARKGKSHRSACSRSIPIYDGKQRFNLKLTYKRSIRVKRSQSGGYAGPVIICRVRYQPISGYKPHKKDVKFMVKNRNIELWLMPLPKSRNYAPYRFILPLPVGKADAYLASFKIRNASGRQIALVR